MKKIALSLTMVALIFTASANDKYEKAMLKNISLVYEANTVDDHQQAINNLTRISNVEKNKWEPYYYITYSYIIMSFMEQDASKKDSYIDLAQAALDKGLAIAPEESELVTLQGFTHTARLNVDPMNRGAQYSGMATKVLRQAIKLNPENPRALLLMGQMMYGTAQFMGGSTTEACAMIEKSLDKFETAKPSHALSPKWGKGQATNALKQCSN